MHTHTRTQREREFWHEGPGSGLQDSGLRGYASMRPPSKSLVWLLSLCPSERLPDGQVFVKVRHCAVIGEVGCRVPVAS